MPRSVLVRDGVLALAVAAALCVDGAVGEHAAGLTPLAVVLAVATSAPLVWRTRAPLVVLVLVTAGITACLLTFEPAEAAVLPGLLALYTVAAQGHRRRTLVVGGVMAVVVTALVVALSPHGVLSADAFFNVAVVLVALLVGDTVRSRRPTMAVILERAQREERLRIANHLTTSSPTTSWPSTSRPAWPPTSSTAVPSRPAGRCWRSSASPARRSRTCAARWAACARTAPRRSRPPRASARSATCRARPGGRDHVRLDSTGAERRVPAPVDVADTASSRRRSRTSSGTPTPAAPT